MIITKHRCERFEERAIVDFAGNNRLYRNFQILDDIKNHLKLIRATTFWSFVVQWEYCVYIIKNNTLITVYENKRYMSKLEKRKYKKKMKEYWYKNIAIDKNLRVNIIKLFDFSKLEYN